MKKLLLIVLILVLSIPWISQSQETKDTSPETDEQAFTRYCSLGDKADAKLVATDFAGAIEGYQAIVDDMFKRKSVDGFVMGKAALGCMLAYVQLGKYQEAAQIWTGKPDDRWAIGIESLEKGSCSTNDAVLTLELYGFLHSLSKGDRAQATGAVNDYMGRFCQYFKQKDPQHLPMAISQWRIDLEEIYEKNIPPEAMEEIDKFAADSCAKDAGYKNHRFLLTPSKWEITWGSPADSEESKIESPQK
jgi:hypothetical protein